MKTVRRIAIVTLLSIITIILGLELLLRFVDPLGVFVYTYDVYQHSMLTIDDPTGYRLPTGVHEWRSYTVTILANGTRFVPAGVNSDCTLATIGDSFTFGHSVEDAETFTNILAFHTRAHWLNTGRQGYSIDNMRRVEDAYPADGYIYLITYNDSMSPVGYLPKPSHIPRALEAYINFLLVETPPIDPDYFMTTLAEMDLDHTLLIGFNDDPLAQTAIATYGGALIHPYTSRVSRGDGHPSAIGHAQIADAMQPYLPAFTERVCHD